MTTKFWIASLCNFQQLINSYSFFLHFKIILRHKYKTNYSKNILVNNLIYKIAILSAPWLISHFHLADPVWFANVCHLVIYGLTWGPIFKQVRVMLKEFIVGKNLLPQIANGTEFNVVAIWSKKPHVLTYFL